jgi:hypothetical protein
MDEKSFIAGLLVKCTDLPKTEGEVSHLQTGQKSTRLRTGQVYHQHGKEKWATAQKVENTVFHPQKSFRILPERVTWRIRIIL